MPQSDLTTYARIRNAALRLFADQGARATSIRAVAKAAGVSPGLVQHHFKTKAELQTAIEIYVNEKVTEVARASLTDEGKPGTITFGHKIVDFIRENPDIIRYARRVMLEDDTLGRRLFDQLVAAGHLLMDRAERQGFLRTDVDRQWCVLNVMLVIIGPVLFEPGINRHLDRPFRSEESLARWDAAVDNMLCHGIYREEPEKKLPRKTRTRKKSGRK